MNKKTIISIIIIVLVIGLIAGVGLVYKTKEVEQPVVTTEESISQSTIQPITPKPLDEQEPESSSELKVYTNSKYGYSIKYPKDWYVTEDSPKTGWPHLTEQHTDFSPIKNYDQYPSQAFYCSVIVWRNPSRLPVHEWLKEENPSHPALVSGEQIIINGRQAIKHEPKGNAYYIDIYLTRGNKAYQLSYIEKTKKGEYLDTFMRMVNGFEVY